MSVALALTASALDVQDEIAAKLRELEREICPLATGHPLGFLSVSAIAIIFAR